MILVVRKVRALNRWMTLAARSTEELFRGLQQLENVEDYNKGTIAIIRQKSIIRTNHSANLGQSEWRPYGPQGFERLTVVVSKTKAWKSEVIELAASSLMSNRCASGQEDLQICQQTRSETLWGRYGEKLSKNSLAVLTCQVKRYQK